MKAVLLAAGRGTRLAPLTHSVPKILAPLAGSTLLEHQLSYLERNGVTEVALNVHHLSEQVLETLERVQPSIAVRVSEEPELLGTAGALLPLRDFLSESFVVLYGDVLTDASLEALLARHREAGGIATICCYRAKETSGKGVVALDAEGRIRSFAEKPEEHTGPAYINAGLYALEPEILDFLGPDNPDFGLHVWPDLLSRGIPIYAHLPDSYVRDVGSPEALAAAERDLAAGAVRW